MPPRNLTIDQYNNTQQLKHFQDSLFDPWPGPFGKAPGNLFRARLAADIKRCEVNNSHVPLSRWLIDESTRRLLLTILRGYWDAGYSANPRPNVINSDREFISFLSTFIKANGLNMYIPSFTCTKKNDTAPSVYDLEESIEVNLRTSRGWCRESVDMLLELFLAGAHFVVLHSSEDSTSGRVDNFFENFKLLSQASQAAHSHYTGHKVSLNGQNFPTLALNPTEGTNLDSLQNHNQACLLPVILCDTTSNYNPNSFFQMEGWPPGKSMLGVTKHEYRHAPLAGGYRHGADFKTHQETIWNISTYGASPCSEKRGGAIFLAKASKYCGDGYRGFNPKAWTQHAWFKPELVNFR